MSPEKRSSTLLPQLSWRSQLTTARSFPGSKFSISSKETTRFALPNSSAAVLNRVASGDVSHIDGLLSSNGTVYLINPNGVIVGPGGIIDTAGFLASTLDVENQQFLNGKALLFSGSSTASIINQGTITAWNGNVILLAYQVENAQTYGPPKESLRSAAGNKSY